MRRFQTVHGFDDVLASSTEAFVVLNKLGNGISCDTLVNRLRDSRVPAYFCRFAYACEKPVSLLRRLSIHNLCLRLRDSQ